MEEMKYKRAEHVIGSSLDDAMILTSTESDKFYGMNKVASKIWGLLEQPISKEEVITMLLERFDVEHDQCKKDVDLFFDEMKQAKVIVPSN